MATAKKKASPSRKAPASKETASKTSGKETQLAVEEGSSAPAPWGDIDRLFDDFLERRLGRPFQWEWPTIRGWSGLWEQRAPTVDIIDRDKEILVRAEVPGIEKEDIDVSIVDRTLTIKGASRREVKKDKDDYYRHEIRSGRFSRTVLLPADVDAGKAKASFKNGVVELNLPKAPGAKRQQIDVG